MAELEWLETTSTSVYKYKKTFYNLYCNCFDFFFFSLMKRVSILALISKGGVEVKTN